MPKISLYILLILLLLTACSKKTVDTKHDNMDANRLINESSPYLLQHAYNPVDWYPWGEEALNKAKAENKLLIISVGYAACHWCHVMEHESFEDSLVAQQMNEHFVSIKVDREERPDVDDVYMTAAQLINGRGGWPLNAIALPDGRPIFAGTYFEKGQWMKILDHFAKENAENKEALIEAADKLTAGIVTSNEIPIAEGDLNLSSQELSTIVSRCLTQYDEEYGGRSGAPKFPMPNSYEFLMKYHWLSGDKTALRVTEKALDNMANGGIYDHLGGGFARYSVDKIWLVPHFEKMLYDNGQLVSIYAQAYKLTQKPLYKRVVEGTIEFVERELMLDDNKFYSSLDADSEGEEGKFYVWSKQEIKDVLGPDKSTDLFIDAYDISEGGNWEHTNIPNRVLPMSKLSEKHGMSEADMLNSLESSKQKLLSARSKRVRPGTDDKTLTSWNALMLNGYVDAYDALGEQKYIERAIKNADFLSSQQMSDKGQLFRNYKNGKSSINAFLDDYALTATAFLRLYQSTFDKQWIDKAQLLVDYCDAHFFNEQTTMYDYTSDEDPPLIARKAEYNDNVIPASNSSMARTLFLLGTLTYNKTYLQRSEQMLNNMLPQIRETQFLSFYSNWMQLLLDHVSMPYEVAIVGKDAKMIRNELAKKYLGHTLFLGTESEENLELLKSKSVEGATMIYVCQNKSCKLPVENADDAMPLLKPNWN